MTKEMNKGKSDEITVITDIPGHSINGGTLQSDVIVTGQRPGIVILNRAEKRLCFLSSQ